MKARFATYANKEHLHPRERIRLFLVNESSEEKIQKDPVDWINATGEIFRFAEATDRRGELEMYAAAACSRAAFMRMGTARADLLPGSMNWCLELTFFLRDVRSAPEHFDIYLGSSGINYYPGFPKQHRLNPPIDSRMRGSQREIRFRRYANKSIGQISYIPLYDNGEPIVIPEMPVSEPEWESKLT